MFATNCELALIYSSLQLTTSAEICQDKFKIQQIKMINGSSIEIPNNNIDMQIGTVVTDNRGGCRGPRRTIIPFKR